MFCLSTGRWAPGTPTSEYTLVSRPDPRSKHVLVPTGEGTGSPGVGWHHPGAPGAGAAAADRSRNHGCHPFGGSGVSFRHMLRFCSGSRRLFLPPRSAVLRAPRQPASQLRSPRVTIRGARGSDSGSPRSWHMGFPGLLSLRQPCPQSIHSLGCFVVMNE